MTFANPLLTRKTMLYAELEDSYGVEQTYSDFTSPMLVTNADFTPNITTLDRDLYRNDIGQVPSIIGRKIGMIKFSHEFRGGGSVGSRCRLGRLLLACAMLETVKAARFASAFYETDALGGPVVAWSAGSLDVNLEPKTIKMTVVTPGASGTAAVDISCDDGTVQAGEVLTTATPVVLTLGGFSTAAFTPTWTGSLLAGQTWVVVVYPPGVQYLPTSDGSLMKSMSMKLFMDGTCHHLTGAFGTYKVTAAAGQLSKVDFQFTGFYHDLVDAALPASPVFETTLPHQVELGRLHVDDYGVDGGPSANPLVVETFTFDIANTITPRLSINAAEGVAGYRITERKPTGGIDPEAALVANQAFWNKLSSAKQMPLGIRVGVASGNMVHLFAPSTAYTGLTYKDKTGIRALDAGLKFSRVLGDDEVQIYVC